MTALTANIQRPVRIPVGGLATAELRLAGYTNYGAGNLAYTVYEGSPVVCDVSDTDGYFRDTPAGASVNAATGDVCGGIAAERVDVTSADTADGSKKLTVFRNGVWGFPVGGVAITDIGAPAYFSDSNTITTTSTNNFLAGLIEDVDATYVWVNIAPAFMRVNNSTL